ncbi:nuclease-related domain-containing protein [Neobacillus cucumis]|uniref:nuclease-related domain-containing protein n=1 Tax=Neobacillus cucumis TaxID=1740721 RepID=UPI0028534862|nr:nuclease-related domain-containing protein [Neobacillus cucumis]MDR4950147.1 nuclease-related domain-containing protein [Neobacillus cucumis]
MKLEGLISAQRRLPGVHSALPLLASKQASIEAGIGGEERVAEVLRKYSFPFDHHIFHDLSPSKVENFQVDTFTLSPWFGAVLEVKNIGGTLEFKDNPPQLIRTREDGHKDGYENPVVQLERNYELMSDWLRSRNIKIPLYGAIVLAYPKQMVAVPPKKTKILFPNLVPSYLESIPRVEQKLDLEAFHWLSTELLNSHQMYIPKPICESYHIPFGDFKPGVWCLLCRRIGMVKTPRTWVCPFCNAKDHLAHERTLREWFLIHKRSITNRECREFLGVDIYTANRILNSMNLHSEGKYRYRAYTMDFTLKM